MRTPTTTIQMRRVGTQLWEIWTARRTLPRRRKATTTATTTKAMMTTTMMMRAMKAMQIPPTMCQ
jgi:hypothetical protein